MSHRSDARTTPLLAALLAEASLNQPLTDALDTIARRARADDASADALRHALEAQATAHTAAIEALRAELDTLRQAHEALHHQHDALAAMVTASQPPELAETSPEPPEPARASSAQDLLNVLNARFNQASEHGLSEATEPEPPSAQPWVLGEDALVDVRLYLLGGVLLAVQRKPVTRAQWERVMGRAAPLWKDRIPQKANDWMGRLLQDAASNEARRLDARLTPEHPISDISLIDALRFCNELSRQEGMEPCYELSASACTYLGGAGYRLPVGQEWRTLAAATPRAERGLWHAGNSDGMLQPVGLWRPDAHGLYDLLGNVFEWVWPGATVCAYNSAACAYGGSYLSPYGACSETQPHTVAELRETRWDVGFRVVRTLSKG